MLHAQAGLFDSNQRKVTDEELILCALGEFQARGKELINRQLPLDRLRGAVRRAAEILASDELSDERFARGLEALGANVKRVPSFVAKHPFRVTVGAELAGRATDVFRALNKQNN